MEMLTTLAHQVLSDPQSLSELLEGALSQHSVNPLTGFHGAGVLEIFDNDDGDTYRAVYTVRFSEFIYVLHAFQKKSRQGIQTSKRGIDLIHTRLRTAELEYREWLTLQ